MSSYGKDFDELIKLYGRKQKTDEKKKVFISEEPQEVFHSSDASKLSETDSVSPYDLDDDDDIEGYISVLHSKSTDGSKREKELSVEYLENDIDVFQSADDWDGTKPSAISDLICIMGHNQ